MKIGFFTKYGPILGLEVNVGMVAGLQKKLSDAKLIIDENEKEMANMRKKIASLEKTVAKMAKQEKVDECDTMDLVDMLDGVTLPTRHLTSPTDQYIYSSGFRLIDLRILRSALSTSQLCDHR